MTSGDRLIDLGRRQFLHGGGLATAGALATPRATAQRQTPARAVSARVAYPSSRIADVNQLELNEPLPNDKQSRGNITKPAAAPDSTRLLSFKSQHDKG